MLVDCPDLNRESITYCVDEGEPKYPTSLAVDPSGEYVYLVSTKTLLIQKFDIYGNLAASWGPEGTSGWFLMEPAGVAVDAAGDVYVTDIWQSLILKFDPYGNLITSWPYSTGYSFNPTGIAVGPSGIYLTDYYNSLVHRLDYTGEFIVSWGGYDGTLDGEFTYPAAVAVDSLGIVFVADTLNNRIQSFTSTWESCDGIDAGGFNRPFGIGADSSGNVYVADTFNHRILKYRFTPTNVVIDGCDSGVENQELADDSYMSDLISDCVDAAKNHGQFVNCVDELAVGWVGSGLITNNEKSAIVNCASHTTIGQ